LRTSTDRHIVGKPGSIPSGPAGFYVSSAVSHTDGGAFGPPSGQPGIASAYPTRSVFLAFDRPKLSRSSSHASSIPTLSGIYARTVAANSTESVSAGTSTATSTSTSSPSSSACTPCTGNTASTRDQWCDGFDINTDYYTEVPCTGVTREYWFELTEIEGSPDGYVFLLQKSPRHANSL
jgi:hypothetical protein